MHVISHFSFYPAANLVASVGGVREGGDVRSSNTEFELPLISLKKNSSHFCTEVLQYNASNRHAWIMQ